MLSLALVLTAPPKSPPALDPSQQVVVRETVGGCYGSTHREDWWRALGQEFVCMGRSVPLERVRALRALALSAPEEVEDLLATLGVTAGALAEHRKDVVAAAFPPAWRREGQEPKLPEQLEPLLDWKRLRGALERQVKSEGWVSTAYQEVEVVLPGDPEITLKARGLTPWMLPWEIEAGARKWTSPDVRLSRAVVALLAEDSPSRDFLDGEQYWTEDVWKDESLWRQLIGDEVDAGLAKERYVELDGWKEASVLLRVDDVRTGMINLKPLAMFFELSARGPRAIEGVRWWNLLVDDEPTSTWHDLLDTWRAASRAVERETWIGEWIRIAPGRSVRLQVVGSRGIGETLMDALVLPAWRDAGFRGEPDFELTLRKDGHWFATIFLAADERGGLVTVTHRSAGSTHWLDNVDLAFHPRGEVPTYARVDAEGRWEVRTLR